MNQFCPATMIARTTLGTHIPRISARTVTHRLREIGERPPYTMYILYAAFLFWPSICAYFTHYSNTTFKLVSCSEKNSSMSAETLSQCPTYIGP